MWFTFSYIYQRIGLQHPIYRNTSLMINAGEKVTGRPLGIPFQKAKKTQSLDKAHQTTTVTPKGHGPRSVLNALHSLKVALQSRKSTIRQFPKNSPDTATEKVASGTMPSVMVPRNPAIEKKRNAPNLTT
jgi:hypothetical protein